ncbi:unnamed protein product [Microthlaspi erraticum]|uniref:NB-ARC domain-containing protein n=1 Tax=Microthlaspi erraticum TaxID=1685480 RepID=A0A6D2HFQ2_9BRAS|nr:unnamed protein product [Microthlaspi erraticum]
MNSGMMLYALTCRMKPGRGCVLREAMLLLRRSLAVFSGNMASLGTHPPPGFIRHKGHYTDLANTVSENASVPDVMNGLHKIKFLKKVIGELLAGSEGLQRVKSLVVVGEYGVGKTTSCQMIFNKEEVRRTYAPMIWVSMHSDEPKEGLGGKICVLKKILKGLGVEDSMLGSIKTEAEEECRNKQEAGESDGETAEEKELSALLYALHSDLRWKKYLIVFDDVREEDNWDEKIGIDEEQLEGMKWGAHLSDGFPKGSGGRVIYFLGLIKHFKIERWFIKVYK